jgi:hypothetical protein
MVVESNVFIGRTIGVNNEQIMEFASKSKKTISRKRNRPIEKRYH